MRLFPYISFFFLFGTLALAAPVRFSFFIAQRYTERPAGIYRRLNPLMI